jgi:hypothetical protein
MRFFMTPAEALDRLAGARARFPDKVFQQSEDGFLQELPAGAEAVAASVRRDPYLSVGSGDLVDTDLLEAPLGSVITLNMPTIRDQDLELAEIGVKWDPSDRAADKALGRYEAWLAEFARDLRAPTVWIYTRPDGTAAPAKPAKERYSDGALGQFERGGRWVQRGLDRQEWRPDRPSSAARSSERADGDSRGNRRSKS